MIFLDFKRRFIFVIAFFSVIICAYPNEILIFRENERSGDYTKYNHFLYQDSLVNRVEELDLVEAIKVSKNSEHYSFISKNQLILGNEKYFKSIELNDSILLNIIGYQLTEQGDLFLFVIDGNNYSVFLAQIDTPKISKLFELEANHIEMQVSSIKDEIYFLSFNNNYEVSFIAYNRSGNLLFEKFIGERTVGVYDIIKDLIYLSIDGELKLLNVNTKDFEEPGLDIGKFTYSYTVNLLNNYIAHTKQDANGLFDLLLFSEEYGNQEIITQNENPIDPIAWISESLLDEVLYTIEILQGK